MQSRNWPGLLAGVAAVLIILAAMPSAAWQERPKRSRDVGAIALDGSGAVFAALPVALKRCCIGAAVLKLDRAGAVRWRRSIGGRGEERIDFLADLKTTGEGDVVT